MINHGPGDVYELDFEADESLLLHRGDDFPIPKLPAGKSIRIRRMLTMASGGGSYFNIRVTGRTIDGTTIDEELFVSTT